MARQAELFPLPPKRTRLKRMHVVDAGSNGPGPGLNAQYQCKRCGELSDWLPGSLTDVRRGIPCPKCNKGDANG